MQSHIVMEWWVLALAVVVVATLSGLVGAEFAALRVRSLIAQQHSEMSATVSTAIARLGAESRTAEEAEMVTLLIRDVREMASAVNRAAPGVFDYEGVMQRLAQAEGSLHPQALLTPA